MKTGLEALLLAKMMVLLVVSFWPGIMNGSVFCYSDLQELILCRWESDRMILGLQNNLLV